MRKFVIVAAAACVLTLGGCWPGKKLFTAQAALPQSTLERLPQSTLALNTPACPCGCPCSTGAACTCGADCKCANCPGKSKGIAPSREEALRSSLDYGCPMVAFNNCPVRSVTGAVSYACPDPSQQAGIAVGWQGTVAKELPPTATDKELVAACVRPVMSQPIYRAISFVPLMQSFGGGNRCVGGNCGGR